MKLISMTDFVLEQQALPFEDSGDESKISDEWTMFMATKLDKIESYAKFLKQPLQLGFFVACDEEGNVLDSPTMTECDTWQRGGNYGQPHLCEDYVMGDCKCSKYQQAKDRVLFEGFTVIKRSTYSIVTNDNDTVWVSWNLSKLVEDLLTYGEYELTSTALKQIGL